MSSRSARLRRHGVLMAAPAAVAALALPGIAGAATVSRTADGVVQYRAASGEVNVPTVSEPVAGTIAVRDSVPLTAGSGCTRVTATEVRCASSRRVDAALGNRNDLFVAEMGLLAVVDGGADDDMYFHNGAAGRSTTRVDFTGGSGVDTATYTAAAGAGVQVTKDGSPNDGRLLPGATATIDRDNIRPDVETLIGTQRNDSLNGAGGTGTGQETFRGLGGDDVLVGNGGNDHFDMGTSADGADRIVGGDDQHFDSVSYENRNAGVFMLPDDGRANDGASGEGDEIVGVEGLFGSAHADSVVGGPSTRGMLVVAGAGDDFVGGSNGGDTLFGGAGRDTLSGGLGADNLQAGDGERDERLDCGANPAGFGDLISRDAVDPAPANCETAQIGRLALTPKAQRVAAGGRVELELRWRHPRAWKQVRQVKLHVTDADLPVGAVVVRPRSGRVTGDGAVAVVRRATRVGHAGKAVTARLALRVDRAMAGRTLDLAVEAVDARGRRQLERAAATVRVAR